jgi:hypothetical protein
MQERIQVEYRGKVYQVQLDRGRTDEGNARAPAAQPRWHATIGGTAVTSFDARPDDSEASVSQRLRAWLAEQPHFGDRDQIHLGGG